MAVPKRRTSRAKRAMRRANHDRVLAASLIPCPNCGDVMLPHRVCPACGHYKGRQVVQVAEQEDS
ncbi:MAG: 50S ribosomal protein L32 [Proteobacteria bacterium]|nr:50S ribosomal protein L32 [Pseudomonadota bacterium]